MKLNELIKNLQELEKDHGGDLEVIVIEEVDEFFGLIDVLSAELVEVPQELDGELDPDPEKNRKFIMINFEFDYENMEKQPRLSLVKGSKDESETES